MMTQFLTNSFTGTRRRIQNNRLERKRYICRRQWTALRLYKPEPSGARTHANRFCLGLKGYRVTDELGKNKNDIRQPKTTSNKPNNPQKTSENMSTLENLTN